ncbi:MAG: peptidyl-prolyl cis-trans isomerase [Pseudomonadota bacterium]
MREADFISAQNSSAVRNQVTQAVAAGSILPKAFDEALNAYASEQRVFSYVVLNEKNIEKPAAASDAQLDTYFAANKKTYDAPEYRKIAILHMTPATLADEKAITDEQVKRDYDSRQNAYKKPEQRRVQQIVFTSVEKAEAAKKTLAEGGFFETVLQENGRTVDDADLGLVSREQLLGKTNELFAETTFDLKPGSVSEVIQGPFGPTMIRVSEVVNANVTPLEDVAADIRKDLALRAAADRINELQERIEDARAGRVSLQEAAKSAGLDVRIIDAVDARGRDKNGKTITDIPESSSVLREAFRTEVGGRAPAIESQPNGFTWVDTLEITATRERSLSEVKAKVAEDWMKAEIQKAIEAKADAMAKATKAGQSLADLAKEAGAEVKTSASLVRNGREPGLPASAVAAGFKGDKSLVTVTPGDGTSRIVLKVDEVKGANADPIPDQQAQQINAGAQDDLMIQFIANLQSNYDVTHNPTLIQQLVTRQPRQQY